MADIRYNLFVLQGGEWDLEQAFGPGTCGEAVQAAEALMNATEGRPEGAQVTRAVTRVSGLQEVTILSAWPAMAQAVVRQPVVGPRPLKATVMAGPSVINRRPEVVSAFPA